MSTYCIASSHGPEENAIVFIFLKRTLITSTPDCHPPPPEIHGAISLQKWLCALQFAILASHPTAPAIDNSKKSNVYLQTLAFSCKNIAENLLRLLCAYRGSLVQCSKRNQANHRRLKLGKGYLVALA